MLREARALAAVQHPNIVHVYGIDRHDGRVGYWTDFVRGKTLSFLVAAQGPFGYREAALIGLDVAKALSAVHRAGVLHRDIKAENVMREEGGRILLMDFGLTTLPQSQTGNRRNTNLHGPRVVQWQPGDGGHRYLRHGRAALLPGYRPASGPVGRIDGERGRRRNLQEKSADRFAARPFRVFYAHGQHGHGDGSRKAICQRGTAGGGAGRISGRAPAGRRGLRSVEDHK